MVRVWFNHWFSTSYRLIQLMKDNKDEQVYVIGTNKQVDSVIQKVCDEWYEEPVLEENEYLDYCLEFCKAHKIDVFVPRQFMVMISQNIDKFNELGVKVMVDDYSIIELLNNKAKAYDFFRECEGLNIPEYCIVNNVEQFVEAYKQLKQKYEKICIKFVKDEGGLSFRTISENTDIFGRLRQYAGSEISYEMLVEALKEGKEFDDLMVMPFLAEEEISVDCLNTDNGLIAVPRIKANGRHEIVKFDEDILKMVNTIMNKIKLEQPCNVQFKLKDGIPYLLEINTRMSGGLQMSCEAANVNIPNIAFNKLMGKNVAWKIDTSEKKVSYIEMPVVL